MKRQFFVYPILFCLCISLFVCGGCRQKIETSSDEIRASDWHVSGSEVSGMLEFNDEYAYLYIDNGDDSCVISGLCVITDDNIRIIDNGLKSEYLFTYILGGESLVLGYGGKEAVFEKGRL